MNARLKEVSRFVLLLVFSLTAYGSAVSANTNEDEIREFLSRFVSAQNDRDYAAIAESWNPEGEVFTLAGGIYKGRSQIKDFFEKGFSKSYVGARFHYYLQFIRFDGNDRATIDGVWKVTDGGPEGYPSCGMFLINLSKRDSRWGIDVAYSTVPRRGHTREHGRTLSWTKICDEN